MIKKEMIAMLLAGGQGSRLGVLTAKVAKPAVAFGGKYRIIDFTLSNCHNSGIDTVGVLTQYKPLALNAYIGIGSDWDLDRRDGGVFVLPPYMSEEGGQWYKGTADAIYQNLNFLEQMNPEYVLILSGDHIYKMNYAKMLAFHKEEQADVTIAVIPVPWEDASRFGIMSTDENARIVEFAEKPKEPKSNLASMGIYIFSWAVLRRYLQEDAELADSCHDFGKNVIPAMLKGRKRLMAYAFEGYWKDVGTVESYWQANMDLLEEKPSLDLFDNAWRIYSVNPARPPHYLGPNAKVNRSFINEGCQIFGEVEHSVVFPNVVIEKGAVVRDSILMPGVYIGAGCRVEKAVVGRQVRLGDNCRIGTPVNAKGRRDIVVIAEKIKLPAETVVDKTLSCYTELACALAGREGK